MVTPGTVTEPSMLDASRNNYIAAITSDGKRIGIAYADITTGEFAATEYSPAHRRKRNWRPVAN
ncbi:MAG: hypothetical protein R2839_12685 [Thermomicrobiales bacterium]